MTDGSKGPQFVIEVSFQDTKADQVNNLKPDVNCANHHMCILV